MKRTILTLILMFTISLATGGNDIWQNLFKEKLQEAKEGNSSAQFDVAGMYQNGRGVKPDLAKAITGRWTRSLMRDAMIPTTPWCHSSW